jgi:hypothetical protein
MKRPIVIMAIALTAAAGAYSQSLASFENAFIGFAGDMAGSLAANSTIGSEWSDAYVGGFPHFGAGISAGAVFTSSDGTKPLFDALGATLPPALKGLGVPVPAAVATFKIGLPFLPLDIGVKGGYMPASAGKAFKLLTGVTTDYTNVGIQLRYGLLKQNILLPNVSVGAAYNYQKGKLKAPTGIGSQSVNDGSGNGITMSSPDLSLGWTSSTVDFTTQVSKQFLFLVPYLGAGYTVGKSTVTGGLDSQITGTTGSLATLQSYLAANGGSLGATGFSYTASSTAPVFRLYGGLSFRIIMIDIDTQVMYLPTSKALGFSATTRVQL